MTSPPPSARAEGSLQQSPQFGVNLVQKTRKLCEMRNDLFTTTLSDYASQVILPDLTYRDESAAIREQCSDTKFLRWHVWNVCHRSASLWVCPSAKYSAAEYNPPCFAAQPLPSTPLRLGKLR